MNANLLLPLVLEFLIKVELCGAAASHLLFRTLTRPFNAEQNRISITILGASLYITNAALIVDQVGGTPLSTFNWLTRCLCSFPLVRLIDSSG